MRRSADAWRAGHRLLFAAAVATGAVLRLHAVRDQLLVSDEWHGPHAAALASYAGLLRLATIGATSMPMNLYDKLLLDTVGWSELGLRLPSLAAGLAALVVFPLWLRRTFSPLVVVVFAWLLAVSPFLVFYSRYARPYALVALLGFATLLAGWRWALEGRRRDALVFALCGVAVAVLHVVEIRVLVGLGVLLAVAARVQRERWAAPRPRPRAILLVTLSACLPVAALLLPALLGAEQRLGLAVGQGRPGLATLGGALELLCGSADPVAIGASTALAALGAVTLVRRQPLLAWLGLGLSLVCIASVYVTHPKDSHVPIVFARYVIPVVPLLSLSAACGLATLLERPAAGAVSAGSTRSGLPPAARGIVAAGLVTALYVSGPLPELYGTPNDFTNHKAYQACYVPSRTGNAYLEQLRGFAHLEPRVREPAADPDAQAHPFYARVAEDPDVVALIEYPLPVGDIVSVHHLAQRVHGKRVLGGYLPEPASARIDVLPGIVSTHWGVGSVLGEVRDAGALHFRNLVDLSDVQAALRSPARYLVLHPALVAGLPRNSGLAEGLERVRALYTAAVGQPIVSDGTLIVFDLRGSARGG